MCYSKYFISLQQILLFIVELQGCFISYPPDMFLLPVFFPCLLKTCQTDLKCFMHIKMKTICLILRVTVQKLPLESGFACNFMHSQIHCALLLAYRKQIWEMCWRGLWKPFVKLCHQRDRRAGIFSQSVMKFSASLCTARLSLPKMTFSSS